MKDSQKSAWTNPPIDDFEVDGTPDHGRARAGKTDPRICPDCGKIHGDPAKTFDSKEEASLHAQACREELEAVMKRYPALNCVVAVFATSASSLTMDGVASADTAEVAAFINHLMKQPGVAREALALKLADMGAKAEAPGAVQ